MYVSFYKQMLNFVKSKISFLPIRDFFKGPFDHSTIELFENNIQVMLFMHYREFALIFFSHFSFFRFVLGFFSITPPF